MAIFAVVCLFLPVKSFAQGGSINSITFGPMGTPKGGVTVTVCASTATVVGGVCTPAESDAACCFTDSTLGTRLTPPPSGGTILSDGLGNYTVWAAPGLYKVSYSGAGVTSTTLTVPVSCVPGGTNCTGLGAQLNVGNVFTTAGVFTNTQMNPFQQVNVNSVSFQTELQFDQTAANFTTAALTTGIATPSNATQRQIDAFESYVTSACNSVSRTTCNTGAGYFHGRAIGNGAAVWGLNPVVSDTFGTTTTNLIGAESDVNIHGTPQYAVGYDAIICLGCGSDTRQGTVPASAHAFHVAGVNVGWSNGFITDRAAVSTYGLFLGGQNGTANTRSQQIALQGFNAGNVAQTATIYADANGNVIVTPSSGAGISLQVNGNGIGVPGSTSGANSLKAPAVAGSATTTLPTAGGTLLSTGNGAGNLIQTQRAASCTTGAAANSVCSTTVTWANAFADANYTATCTLVNPNVAQSGVTHIAGAPLAASVSVEISNFSTASAASGTIHCTAIHD